MIKALIPFWIYWGLLVLGYLFFLYMPLLFFLVLPMLLVIIPIWFVIVYLIGDAVSRRGNFRKISIRIGVSLLCSFFTIMLFPVSSWIYDTMQWDKFNLASLIRNFNEKPLWIMFAVHFFAFWTGEEMGHMAAKADEEAHNEPKAEEQ